MTEVRELEKKLSEANSDRSLMKQQVRASALAAFSLFFFGFSRPSPVRAHYTTNTPAATRS